MKQTSTSVLPVHVFMAEHVLMALHSSTVTALMAMQVCLVYSLGQLAHQTKEGKLFK